MTIQIVVQTDDGLAVDANSYVDAAYVKQFHENRGTKVTLDDGTVVLFGEAGYTDDQIDSACIRCTDYIDTRDVYRAKPLTDTQLTEFPRDCLTDDKGRRYVGIFDRLKRATAEYVAYDLQGLLFVVPTVDASGQQIVLKREKVGPIEEETQYAPTTTLVTIKSFPITDNLLAGLTETFRIRTVRV